KRDRKRRNNARHPFDGAAKSSRIACDVEKNHQRTERACGREYADAFQPGYGDGVSQAQMGVENKNERREQYQYGDDVEEPFEDDRGKGAGRAHMFVAREKIWANDLARARGQ